ncbi:MAG: translation initiation factor IF-3 [Microbacteriaceae bacterium]
MSDPRTNDRIRVPEVRLVGPAGEQVGVVSIDVALRLAQEADLDLVEVAPTSKPPVAKIMDYGKFKYEEAQKAKEARRNQANTILKEVRFRLKIDVHDYETKMKRAVGFLQAGDKVKAMILFRGREQSRPDQGVRLLQRFAEDVSEFGSVESTPTIDGRNMVMVIGPVKTKAAAKAEADAKRTTSKSERAAKSADEAASAPAKTPAAPAPKAEAPVAEFVKSTTPRVSAPRTSAPRSEGARSDSPRSDAPRSDAPRTSAPRTEAPRAEAPKAEAPKAEAPKTDAAAAEPKAAEPKAAEPKAAESKDSAPKASAPKAPAAPKVAPRPAIVPKPATAAAAAKVAAAKAAPKKD